MDDPLLGSLLRQGNVRPDPLRLGLGVMPTCAVRRRDGSVSDRIHALGQLTKGLWWEMTSVPDLRRQCEALGRHLAHQPVTTRQMAATAATFSSRLGCHS